MLKVVTAKEAEEIIKEKFSPYVIEAEKVDLKDSANRILSEDIVSIENIPSFNRSTVDGFAVKARDTFGSSESIPAQFVLKGEIYMGDKANSVLCEGECIKISTGGMLPEGADAALMVEHTDTSFDNICLAYKAVSPFENVTKLGDDVKEGEAVLKQGTLITPREIGVLAAMGIEKINVYKKPKVGIISTGDELIEISQKPNCGQVRDVNSYMLYSLMNSFGCESKTYGIIKDRYDEIKACVKKANEENDIVLISGGSSAGTKDMTIDIINSLGESYLHGIAIKPGKPTIIGNIKGRPIFGLPGHPLACYFISLLFIRPLIDLILKRVRKENVKLGRLTSNISSNHGRQELIPVRIDENNEVTPVLSKSGVISVLSRCDGYINIERNCEGLKKGDEVKVYLLGES